MRKKMIWLCVCLATLGLSGCGVMKDEDVAEIQEGVEELKGLKNELGDRWNDAKKEIEAELQQINWVEEVFFVSDNQMKQEVVLTRTDLPTQQTVTETEAFISDMHTQDWKKVDGLPEQQKPIATYDVGRTFYIGEDDNNIDKTLVLANMVVYDGYVQLQILDGMTKYLDFVIPKDAFYVTYEIDADVVKQLTAFGA